MPPESTHEAVVLHDQTRNELKRAKLRLMTTHSPVQIREPCWLMCEDGKGPGLEE